MTTRRRGTAILAGVAAVAVVAGGIGLSILRQRLATERPAAPTISLVAVFLENTPLAVTITAADQRLSWPTTIDALQRDQTLWRRMHVADWNRVPAPLREDGLDRMLARYRHVLMSPRAWDAMTADDWDRVPQPIRTVAYRHMSAYWAGFYDVGGPEGLPPAWSRTPWPDSLGTTYLGYVEARRRTFIRNEGAPVAWDYLWRRGREIEQQEWPWMDGPR